MKWTIINICYMTGSYLLFGAVIMRVFGALSILDLAVVIGLLILIRVADVVILWRHMTSNTGKKDGAK